MTIKPKRVFAPKTAFFPTVYPPTFSTSPPKRLREKNGLKSPLFILHHKNIFSTITIPSCSNFSLIGSQLSFLYGARTPCVLSAGCPSSSNWVAIPQVTPTDFDMAEYPFGSPSNSSVEVRVSYIIIISRARANCLCCEIHASLPSAHSITNLCWSITRSRSPGWKLKSNFSCSHRVSKRFWPFMLAFWEVKRPK